MRSAAVAERMNRFRHALDQLQSAKSADGSPRVLHSTTLAHLAHQVVQLMVDEVLDWRIVFLDRPLDPP
jgi:hypothetical protein